MALKMNNGFRLVLFWGLLFYTYIGVMADDLVQAEPETVGISAEGLVALKQGMQRYIDDGKVAGSVALIARKGKVVYHQSLGMQNIEAAIPMSKGSIFRQASQTKAIVAVATMMLQERGKLNINDPVGLYLPEFLKTTVAVSDDQDGYQVVAAKRPITIKDLLMHTSGIGYGDETDLPYDAWQKAGIEGFYFADRQQPIADIVSKMAELPFNAQPGEQFVYGYNYDILGVLIEKVSGQSLADFLRTELFEPLQMKDTFFFLPQEQQYRDRLTVVYTPDEQDKTIKPAPTPGNKVGQGAYVDGPRMCFSGGAGLLSTVADYARFLQMLLNGGELDGKRFLSPETVHLMAQDHLNGVKYPWDNGVGFGLGFRVVTDLEEYGKPASIGTYSWGGAYHSVYWVDPQQELIAIYMTQLIPSNDLDDEAKFQELVYKSLLN